jgi:NitT/TauT family transport system permease protein
VRITPVDNAGPGGAAPTPAADVVDPTDVVRERRLQTLPPGVFTVRLSGRLPKWQSWPIQVVLLLVAIGVWEAMSRIGDMRFTISSPKAVAERLGQWWENGSLVDGVLATLSAAGYGFAIGAAAGAVLGLLLGWFRVVGHLLEPFVLALYTLPKVALAPLFVLWFGIDLLPKVVLTAVLIFFLVFLTTQQAAMSVDRASVEMVYLLGGGRLSSLQKVVIPTALVGVFNGFKIALPYALIGPVIGEFMASRKGLGFLIKNSTDQLDPAGVFAGLVVLVVLALLLSLLLKEFEKRVLSWRTEQH